MASLLNTSRPPVFCPGCAHERVVRSLDRAFVDMELPGQDIAIVSDIGCSGLFDTFFKTHALHGLHGRALTYATGLKLARPELTVVVTMGDGGLGIGGAHVLSACRRNLDLTLLVLNNFNYGMTGGQCSTTTPTEAVVGSGFLNRLEKPMEICEVAGAAGAPFVRRLSAYQKDLAELIQEAVRFQGFSLLDIRGLCPGRYTKR
ncbi:MAG: thiamine pyrophosphate-dependent enzyme, partial [Thermodesulfobacteriota bacterium]